MPRRIRNNRINIVKKLFHAELEQRVEAANAIVTADAKRLCPVDLGDLRASIDNAVIKLSESKISGLNGTNKDYAPYVELGTGEYAENNTGRKGGWYFTSERSSLSGGKLKPVSQLKDGRYLYFTHGSKAQPYLRPAIINNERTIKRIFTFG